MYLNKKQGGFTLLELLVVITLLAILSVGALMAYDGLTESAQAAAKSNNTAALDRAIRAYATIAQKYPNNYDHLITNTGASLTFAAEITNTHLASVNITDPAFRAVFDKMFEEKGIDTIKVRQIAAMTPDLVPNLQHTNGAGTDVSATAISAINNFAIVPDSNGAGSPCSFAGTAVANKLNGEAVSIQDANHLNALNNALEIQSCDFIVAFGFGHDAAHSTFKSRAEIATAPTHTTADVNPAKNYARYIALFRVGADKNADDNIDATELFDKPRLLNVVCAEGHPIDEELAEALEK